jgi:hypothetical protein
LPWALPADNLRSRTQPLAGGEHQEGVVKHRAIRGVALAGIIGAFGLGSMLLPDVAPAANIFSHRHLTVRTLEVQEWSGSAWKTATKLEKGKGYRFRVELINSAPGGPLLAISPHTEIAYHELSLEITSDESCYAFPSDAAAGAVYHRFVASPAAPGGRLERYQRTKQVVPVLAPFTWQCATTTIASLPTARRPKLNISARESVPMSNQSGSGPLLPQTPGRELGQTCSSNGQCHSGFCDPSKKCVPAKGTGAEGDFCTVHDHCDDLYKCRNKKCSKGSASGASCPGGNVDCQSGSCDSGLGTGGTNKCVPPPGLGNTGEYCSKAAHCKSNRCTANKCETLKALGQSCPGGNAQCDSGFCDAGFGSGGTNKCVPASGKGNTGQYCSQNGHCKPGKACKSNKCQ